MKCELCRRKFTTNAKKDQHLFTHFARENCVKCDQNLLRIGSQLYVFVLHNDSTCIGADEKKEPDSDASDLSDGQVKLDGKCWAENENCVSINEQYELEEVHVKEEIIGIADRKNVVTSFFSPEMRETTVSTQKQGKRTRHKTTEITQINSNLGKKKRTACDLLQNERQTILSKSSKCKKQQRATTFSKCEFTGCDKLISNKNKRQHMATHSGERFECDICHSSLASKAGLRAHFHLHFPVKELKCGTCNTHYKSESSLSQHIRFVHNKEAKRFICTICGRALRKKYLLKEHMYKHSGEKPFACNYNGCEKRFFTKSHRNEHLRSHTGEKPYKCSIDDCNREFGYATDFKRHKFSAHGISARTFKCPLCSKIFAENTTLKSHLKKHKD